MLAKLLPPELNPDVVEAFPFAELFLPMPVAAFLAAEPAPDAKLDANPPNADAIDAPSPPRD
jgi:hypothetical protein